MQRRKHGVNLSEGIPIQVIHTGGCHCGKVRFEVEAPAQLRVTECNCSICSKSGHLHLIVPKHKFRLVEGKKHLETYEFNTKTAKHYFCRKCGIKSFYIPRSHPDGYSINARCIESDTIESIEVTSSNGKEWEKLYPEGRGAFS